MVWTLREEQKRRKELAKLTTREIAISTCIKVDRLLEEMAARPGQARVWGAFAFGIIGTIFSLYAVIQVG